LYVLHRYCECYQAGIPCSDACKCTVCKNGKFDRQHKHDDNKSKKAKATTTTNVTSHLYNHLSTTQQQQQKHAIQPAVSAAIQPQTQPTLATPQPQTQSAVVAVQIPSSTKSAHSPTAPSPEGTAGSSAPMFNDPQSGGDTAYKGNISITAAASQQTIQSHARLRLQQPVSVKRTADITEQQQRYKHPRSVNNVDMALRSSIAAK
jgi:hypothetical protein